MQSFDVVSLLYIRFLRTTGFLPFEGYDYNFFGTRISFIFYFISINTILASYVSYIYHEGLKEIDTVFEMIFMISITIRYFILIPRRYELLKLIATCREIWYDCDDDGHRSVISYERKIRRLFLFMITTSVITNILYPITALTIKDDGVNNTIRHLPYRWFVKDPIDPWPGYRATFFIQWFIGFNAATVSLLLDITAPFLIMISCGYFKVLQNRLSDITSRVNNFQISNKNIDKELVDCSRFHQNLLEFCEKINYLSRPLFLAQLACTGSNISLICLKLVGNDPGKPKYAAILILCFGQLFICNWAPDYLTNESGDVSTAAYFASMVCMKCRVGKNLIIMIARAQRPVKITIGGSISLSLESFRVILSKAMSFFTVLRNFNA